MAPLTTLQHFVVPPRWVFVKITDEQGYSGWGEASLEGHSRAVIGALEEMGERIKGREGGDIERIWQLLYRGSFYRGGPVLMSALAGIDCALWDLKGKRLGVPVWELLGGKVRDKIPVYAWIGGDEPGDVEAAAKTRLSQGYRTVKMNATASTPWLTSAQTLTSTLTRLQTVTSLGLTCALDFHGRLHKPMAKQLARLLESQPYSLESRPDPQPLGSQPETDCLESQPTHPQHPPHHMYRRPLFIEEPLLSEHPAAIAQLASQTTIPIALGERLYSRWDVRPFLERGCVDILQPDVAHAGGISEVKRIAAMAEAYDVAIAPHCPLGPLALAACLAVAAGTQNFVVQEMGRGIHYNTGVAGDVELETYLEEGGRDVFEVQEGYVKVLEGPGLGVRIDEEVVRRLSQGAEHWRVMGFVGEEEGELREW